MTPDSPVFTHQLSHLTGIAGSRLSDESGLAAVAIGAANAVGLSAHGPPVVRSGPAGIVVCLLCHGGHVVLHSQPDNASCLVDIVAAAPSNAARGIDVIARRLGVESPATGDRR